MSDNLILEIEVEVFKFFTSKPVFLENTILRSKGSNRGMIRVVKGNERIRQSPMSTRWSGIEIVVMDDLVGLCKTLQNHYDFEVVKPVLESYGKAIELIGPSGSGQIAKMINQICIAGLVQGLAEGMAFGKKANVDMEKVLSVISKGAAQSWQMVNRYRTMLDGKFDYGFAVDWMRKDLSICFNEAKKNGASLPVTEIVDKYYEEVQKNGGNRLDTSSLMTLVDK